jgi:glycosyltransferase involved in cell wall biosynthesis
MRVKILTAWAWGIPVVSTTVGCAGIPVHPGTDILVADGEAEFAAAVLRVLEDRGTAARLAAAGRRYAEEQFDWRVVCRKLDEVYAAVEGR